MREVIGGITDDQLGAPTPCTDDTVADLVDHVDELTRGATGLALGDGDAMVAGRHALHREPDWQGVLADRLDALGAAWDDQAAWEGTGNVPGFDLSNETWAKIALTELVVHGWDLAVATGQRVDLPTPTLQACFDHVVAFIPDSPVPELWGPPVEVAGSAPLLDQIVGITGRTPVGANIAG
jgi:uncharacterized protein (TIGR03086 family)